MRLIDITLIVLVITWLGGLSFKIGGGLLHLLLVVAAVVFVGRLLGVNV